MSNEADYLRAELRSLETKAKVLHDALSEAACMLEGLVANKHRVVPLHWQNARETTVRVFALLHGPCMRSELTPHDWPGVSRGPSATATERAANMRDMTKGAAVLGTTESQP